MLEALPKLPKENFTPPEEKPEPEPEEETPETE